jgi:hypothetical protein
MLPTLGMLMEQHQRPILSSLNGFALNFPMILRIVAYSRGPPVDAEGRQTMLDFPQDNLIVLCSRTTSNIVR